eukprot:CAMPEP_0182888856 /NCGR_PEP_ID=MMETSP0034_2-20130328/21686_1 /TAXON_ID=156128 /ORGANISM="Nephroselmis pyriformis, Strain CCMP717" /LENGTH=485 /DNA_ID=CAMNT_0025022311 /DNA_START=181 /DNA_END=1634 /DNA_ORIENTATION=-
MRAMASRAALAAALWALQAAMHIEQAQCQGEGSEDGDMGVTTEPPRPPPDEGGTKWFGVSSQNLRYIIAAVVCTVVAFFTITSLYYHLKRRRNRVEQLTGEGEGVQMADGQMGAHQGNYVPPGVQGPTYMPHSALSDRSGQSGTFGREDSFSASMASQSVHMSPHAYDAAASSRAGDYSLPGGKQDSRRSSTSVLSSSMSSSAANRIQIIPWEQIKIGKAIGKGAFKSVHLARWNAVEVAITKVSETMMEREVAVMAKLSKHPNLVQMFGVSNDLTNPSSMDQYLVMELMPHGSLDVLLQTSVAEGKRFTEPDRLSIAEQICAGMAAISGENVIHADLACRNVLVQSMAPFLVKISDFGLAKQQYTSALQYYNTTNNGIPVRWSSPEVFTQGKWSEASDVWAFGVTLWEIWSDGGIPFGLGPSGAEIQKMVLGGARLDQPDRCPDEVYEVMMKCWAEKPEDRPSFRQLMMEDFAALATGSSAEKV